MKESYLEAKRLGATDALHAVGCAAYDVLVADSAKWTTSVGEDAFAAALACLVMDKVIQLKGPVKRSRSRIEKSLDEMSHYYYYPNQGWWASKQARAKHMTLAELVWARKDCHDTATGGMPENEGKYKDEGTIYAAEINKRTGGEEVKEVH